MKVLVVEDEQRISQFLKKGLTEKGYAVDAVGDADAALERTAAAAPDLIILDLLLPGSRDGLELCRELRARGVRAKIIMLTARDTVENKIEGLDAGADDYLTKPFALDELLARLRALLRRVGAPAGGDGFADEVLSFSDLTLNLATREVRRGDRAIDLSRTEFNLLELFLEHPRQVLTRSQIFERVWGYDFGASSNALGVYVGYLRRKTEAGGESRVLHTVRGVGYVLRDG